MRCNPTRISLHAHPVAVATVEHRKQGVSVNSAMGGMPCMVTMGDRGMKQNANSHLDKKVKDQITAQTLEAVTLCVCVCVCVCVIHSVSQHSEKSPKMDP